MTAPLKVDDSTDELITHSAHFLGISKKEFVARAVRSYAVEQRSELEKGVRHAMAMLDETMESKVAVLTGVSKEDVERLGGV
jgi:uncharacterized protein (DUF1778 family)